MIMQKLIDQYPFTVMPLKQDAGGGFLISFPDLPGCMSDGETIEEAIQNAEDAINCWIQTQLASGKDIPKPHSADKELVQFVTRLSNALHVKLKQRAEQQGKSLNKLVQKIIQEKIYY